jgi:hypothetical protein
VVRICGALLLCAAFGGALGLEGTIPQAEARRKKDEGGYALVTQISGYLAHFRYIFESARVCGRLRELSAKRLLFYFWI